MKDFVIVEHVQSGQARPYADSIYAAYISKRREGVLTDGSNFWIQLKESDVRELARVLVRPFVDNPENCFQPRLAECRSEEPTKEMIAESANEHWRPTKGSRWFVKIIETYTD
jgi:hypothetical protein